MVPNSLCRLTVQCDADNAVDVALPCELPVCELLPSIVDTAIGDGAGGADACRWQLARVGGPALADAVSLKDNGVRDGEVLLLTVDEPAAPRWVVLDPGHTLTQTGSTTTGLTQRVLPPVCCLLMAVVSVAALAWTATPAALVTAAVVAAAAAVTAVVTRRVRADAWLCVPLAVVAVLFTAATGFLAVPTGSVAAHVLLASAAAFFAATTLARLTDCGTPCLTAISVVTMLAAVVATIAVMWGWHAEASGAALGALSLALLASAPRIAMVLAGIRPAEDVPTARAALAHRMLTGLVAGASTSAAAGAAVAAFGADGSAPARVGFTAAVGVVLLLRARTYTDDGRRAALVISGLLSATAAVAVVASAHPEQAHWIGLLAAAAGAVALCPLSHVTSNPLARRSVEVLDYVALAAVVPAACWVGGVFGLARSVSLL